MKAALGYIHRPFVTAKFMRSVFELMAADADGRHLFDHRIVAVPCALYLNLGRNEVVRKFLDCYPADVEVLLMLDDDHSFTPEQGFEIVGLVNSQRPVVSGLYFAQDERRRRPLVLRRHGADETFDTIWEYPKNTLFEVDLIGLGFCAIHRSFLERWRESTGDDSWFDFDAGQGGRFIPEDEGFCRRVQEEGNKIWVHTGIVVGHHKLADTRPAENAGCAARANVRENYECIN